MKEQARMIYLLRLDSSSVPLLHYNLGVASWLLQIRHHETTNELSSRGRKHLPCPSLESRSPSFPRLCGRSCQALPLLRHPIFCFCLSGMVPFSTRTVLAKYSMEKNITVRFLAIRNTIHLCPLTVIPILFNN